MANRRTPTMEVHEVVRLLQAGASDREVAPLVGRNRRTVARYRRWAEQEGVLTGPLPGVGELESRRPLLTIRRAANDLGTSHQTISAAIQHLQDLGIVAEITGKKRDRVFVYRQYVAMLNEGTTSA